MSLRTFLDLTFQVGLENSLDDAAFDRTIEQLLDTCEHVESGVLLLDALQQNVSLDFGGVAEGRMLYVEVEDGDVRFTLGGGLATHGFVQAVGAIYPSGFVGAETVTFKVNGTLVTVVFDSADQSITQVINRINAACALLGFSTPIASNVGGQLKLTSPTTGDTSTIEITGGTGRATLGLPLATGTGANSTPGTSPVEVRRPADPAGASAADGVKGVFFATVKTTSVIVENLSDNTTKVRYCVVGDLTQA